MHEFNRRRLFSAQHVKRFTVVLATAFGCSLAVAQAMRTLPPEAKKGNLQSAGNAKMVIDSKTYAVAPGLMLRNTNNLIVFPATVATPVVVRYTRDQRGAVNRVWILTPAEKAMPEPKS